MEYVVDLIHRGPGGVIKAVTSSEVDVGTPAVAFTAGHRVFATRDADCGANGFRVTERRTGKVVVTWMSDGTY